MTECADGTGLWLGMTVVTDSHCRVAADAGNQVVETQALVREADDEPTVDSLMKVRSFGEWGVAVEVFDAPRPDDGCGALVRKRYSCQRQHEPWTAAIEFNGEYDLRLLVGAHGTIRRGMPDGSYWEAEGSVVAATAAPAQEVGTESMGEISIQWDGGNEGDPGYPTYTPAPVLP